MFRKKEKQIQFCSFCGEEPERRDALIAGPGVFICEECVFKCIEILQEKNVLSESELAIHGYEKLRALSRLNESGQLSDEGFLKTVREMMLESVEQ